MWSISRCLPLSVPLSLLFSSMASRRAFLPPATFLQSDRNANVTIDALVEGVPPLIAPVLFNDGADIVVVAKPGNVRCVPSSNNAGRHLSDNKHSHIDLATAVCRHFGVPDVPQSIVHRLDLATSGLVMFGLNRDATAFMHNEIRAKRVVKVYNALLAGHVGSIGETENITFPLMRDFRRTPFVTVPTRSYVSALAEAANKDCPPNPWLAKLLRTSNSSSITTETVCTPESHGYIQGKSKATLVSMLAVTGKTHQLRVMARQGYGTCIAGDQAYRNGGESGGLYESSREEEAEWAGDMCLNAKKIGFTHPRTKQWIWVECENKWDFSTTFTRQ